MINLLLQVIYADDRLTDGSDGIHLRKADILSPAQDFELLNDFLANFHAHKISVPVFPVVHSFPPDILLYL